MCRLVARGGERTLTDLLVAGLALLGFLGLTFAAAALGGRLTVPSLGSWYAGLRKPAWTPSGSRIGLIWTVLYFLMGLAAWVVWYEVGFLPVFAWVAFAIQLALNVGWSALFFGLRNLRAAFLEILALWVVILATLLAFATVSLLAGLLFLPYLVWVTIAGTLNLKVWRMNSGSISRSSA
jgi:tryptophan-rich sensory protein